MKAARAYHFLRDLPDRLLHARRRAAATALLRKSDVTSILFVCYGNVCRSPYAAAAFARALDSRAGVSVQVASAGFIKPGRVPPETALAAVQRRGLDVSTHRSRLLTPEIIRAASVVVVMAADQAAGIRARYGSGVCLLVLGDLDPLPVATRTITDPWGCTADVFDQVFDRIDRCIGELVRLVDEGSRRHSPLLRAGS
jgi:protein-tyrosine-phosphatase